MKKGLFRYIAFLLFISLFVFFFISLYVQYKNNLELTKTNLINFTDVLSQTIDVQKDTLKTFNNNNQTILINAITANGKIIYPINKSYGKDTNLESLIKTKNGKPDVAIAKGYNNKYNMFYVKKFQREKTTYIISCAATTASFSEILLKSLPQLFLLLALIIIITVFTIKRISKKLISPYKKIKSSLKSLNDGVFSKIFINSNYNEITQISNEIETLSKTLKKNISGQLTEQSKYSFILDNINDGIFAIDENFHIVMINRSGRRIFNSSKEVLGKKLEYLSFNNQLQTSVKQCFSSNQESIFELENKGLIYLVTVKSLSEVVSENIKIKLCVVVLSNITASKKSRQQREDFFANASHELKTPLTAIKGFNELLEINNKDENLNKFIFQISKETDRIMSLISDMLKLSELENKLEKGNDNIDVSKVYLDVVTTLEPIINEKQIEMNVSGEGLIVAGYSHIYDLMKNLIENAIRYNNQNGSVNVSIKSNKNSVKIIVADNGIGVSSAEQSRIFERFYRVEKGRGSQNGGTGLGLAIVKHVCDIYDAKLTFNSKLNIGTEVKVEFFNNQ